VLEKIQVFSVAMPRGLVGRTHEYTTTFATSAADHHSTWRNIPEFLNIYSNKTSGLMQHG